MKFSVNLILILTLVFTSSTKAQVRQSENLKFTVVKSALLPGWGEHEHQRSQRAYVFNGIETALWLFAGYAYTSIKSYESDMYHYALTHAGVTDPHLKSDAFLSEVADFNSMDAYNEHKLRLRQRKELFSADDGEYWSWDSVEERERFLEIKTQRYDWKQRFTYSFGALALNHLVSAIDALYLKRIESNVSLQPKLGPHQTGLRLELRF